jgi:hypothetical protein
MAIKVDLKFTKADGSVPITLTDWVATLSAERQKEFDEAVVRENAAQLASATGNKKIHTDTNIEHWESEEAYKEHNFNDAVHDLVWKSFWEEYITTNEIIFEQVVSNLE